MRHFKGAILSVVIILTLGGYALSQVVQTNQSSEDSLRDIPAKPEENIYNQDISDAPVGESVLRTLRIFDAAAEDDNTDALSELFVPGARIVSVDDKQNALEYTPDALAQALPASIDIQFSHIVDGDNLDYFAVQTFMYLSSDFYSESVSAIFILQKSDLSKITGIVIAPAEYNDWSLGDAAINVLPMGEDRFAFTASWATIAFDSELADKTLRDVSEVSHQEILRGSGEYSVLIAIKRPIMSGSVVSVDVFSAHVLADGNAPIATHQFDVEDLSQRAVFEVALESSELEEGELRIDVHVNDFLVGSRLIKVN